MENGLRTGMGSKLVIATSRREPRQSGGISTTENLHSAVFAPKDRGPSPLQVRAVRMQLRVPDMTAAPHAPQLLTSPHLFASTTFAVQCWLPGVPAPVGLHGERLLTCCGQQEESGGVSGPRGPANNTRIGDIPYSPLYRKYTLDLYRKHTLERHIKTRHAAAVPFSSSSASSQLIVTRGGFTYLSWIHHGPDTPHSSRGRRLRL